MQKNILFISFFCLPALLFAQSIENKLAKAMNGLQSDVQFKNAVISMYVIDAKTNKVVFDKNAAMGLAPASTQKIITSVAAFSLLGNDFTFKTEIAYSGKIIDKVLNGDLYIIGYGDPTLGSARWNATSQEVILQKIETRLMEKGIRKITGTIYAFDKKWESSITPGGWPWEDVGNYYGAGASAINWNENQFDVFLKSGNKVGDAVSITSIKPALNNVNLICEVTSAEKGSGDNTYIYLAPYSNLGYIRGTIPVNENNFVVHGAVPNPSLQFANVVANRLKDKNIMDIASAKSCYSSLDSDLQLPSNSKVINTIQSPQLDSINYWFLKKSINLYGESLLKAISFENENYGTAAKGISIIKDFWSKNGIISSSINIKDGSGLSPANRITTKALVQVLQFAQKQSWYSSFYNALPEMNGIKMKDGYISDVRSYTGFIKSKSGTEYVFALIVNNFSGNPATVREKMWRVLDVLK